VIPRDLGTQLAMNSTLCQQECVMEVGDQVNILALFSNLLVDLCNLSVTIGCTLD